MMKPFALLAAVAAALAQDLSSLPQCGQTCINNMVAIAQSDFGCASGDVVCHCANIDFGYGVRDCAREACGNDETANQVISYGAAYCAAIQTSVSGSSASAVATGALVVLSSAAGSATGVAGSAAASATDSAGNAVSTLATVVSSVASEVSSAVSSVESSISSASESAVSSISSEVSSAISSAASEASSVTSAAGSAAESATSAAGSAASSATQSASETASPAGGAAPRMTGLPVAGAFGLAAWLLL